MNLLKKIVLPVVMLALLFGGVTYVRSQHAAPTIEMVETNVSKVVPKGFILTADSEPSSQPVPTPKTQSTWEFILSNIVITFITAIGAAVSALVLAVLSLLAKKFHLQIGQHEQEIITGAVDTAIHKVEAWANAHKDTPSSNEKLNFAVTTARSLLNTELAKKYTNDQLSHYVEESVHKAFNIDAVEPEVKK